MRIFATQKIEAIKGIQVFKKLLVDDKCPLDEFERKLKSKKDKSELRSIYALMDQVAINRSLSRNKFRVIESCHPTLKCYEFKSRNLRVYAFSITNGKIIVLGGYKKTQKKDIRKLKSYLTEITNSNQLNNL